MSASIRVELLVWVDHLDNSLDAASSLNAFPFDEYCSVEESPHFVSAE